jgi:membrane dipeptidase
MLGDFDFNDTSDAAEGSFGESPMQTDILRMREGKLGAQFWSVYITADIEGPAAVQAALEQVDITRRLIEAYPQELAYAETADQVEQALAEGRIASLMGLEGGHMIGDSLAVLRQMYALGIRYLTITHYKNTSFADSADDEPEHDGLTDFGRELIREMNRLGMLVDLSHVSEATMVDVLDVAQAPVIFSHSNARAVNGDSRNVPDNVLARLPDNGGIVMLVAYPGFVGEELRQWFSLREAERGRLEFLWQGQPEAIEAGMERWQRANPPRNATVSHLADHVDHIRQIAGIDHIGIGGDYDGIPTGVTGMEDVSAYPALFTELARRGYSQEDLEKISSRNMMRVMREAEAYATAHASDPPFETPVPE